MVPPAHMKMLYGRVAAHNKQCYFVEFPTGMHMDTWLAGGDVYWDTVRQFIAKHVCGRKHEESASRTNGNIWAVLCITGSRLESTFSGLSLSFLKFTPSVQNYLHGLKKHEY